MFQIFESLAEAWKYGLIESSNERHEALGYYARVVETFPDAELTKSEEFVDNSAARFDEKTDTYRMSGIDCARYVREHIEQPHDGVIPEYSFRIRGKNGTSTVILDYTVHGVRTHRHMRMTIKPNGQPLSR